MRTERHLRPPELAERWGTTPKRLANDRSLGRGPNYLKFDGMVLYRLTDVEQYEEARLVCTER